jgi:hypothetical protein
MASSLDVGRYTPLRLRLLINLPPRHMKSMVTNVFWQPCRRRRPGLCGVVRARRVLADAPTVFSRYKGRTAHVETIGQLFNNTQQVGSGSGLLISDTGWRPAAARADAGGCGCGRLAAMA